MVFGVVLFFQSTFGDQNNSFWQSFFLPHWYIAYLKAIRKTYYTSDHFLLSFERLKMANLAILWTNSSAFWRFYWWCWKLKANILYDCTVFFGSVKKWYLEWYFFFSQLSAIKITAFDKVFFTPLIYCLLEGHSKNILYLLSFFAKFWEVENGQFGHTLD